MVLQGGAGEATYSNQARKVVAAHKVRDKGVADKDARPVGQGVPCAYELIRLCRGEGAKGIKAFACLRVADIVLVRALRKVGVLDKSKSVFSAVAKGNIVHGVQV